jgi:hypothetical protein
MNKISFTFYCLTLLIILSSASVSGEENNSGRASWEDIRVLSERNIFSRSRVKVAPQPAVELRSIQREATREEDYLLLRGITKQANRFIAYIEDSRTMEIKKVAKDGAIGKGTIKDITLDYVTCELEGKSVMVKIGMTMGGQDAGAAPGYTAGFGSFQQQDILNFSPSVQTDIQATPMNENSKDILERLKERRKKELGE